jgi:type II secretory pathway component HofQ
LRLEVLPKIHPDGKISMLVGINKDTIGMKTEQGYAIDTKSLSSEVTVESGGTVIIGGIFQTTEREDEVKRNLEFVPFTDSRSSTSTTTTEARVETSSDHGSVA